MAEQFSPTAAQAVPVGDLGRRLAQRRGQLGLSREETAIRAGMAPSYLAHLEEHPAAAPGTGVLIRLAEVLQTTVTELHGGDESRPPGRGRAAPHPVLTSLTAQQCRALLSTHGVGRIAVTTLSGPVIVPVNYTVLDGEIVFRTAPASPPAQADGCRVAFEVDRIDDTFGKGWSVLVQGHARAVTDPVEASGLDARSCSEPWAGGRRDLWMRIAPDTVSGRRISV